MTVGTETAVPTAGARLLQCDFCAHRCRLAPGGIGRCGVRANRDGSLVTTVYGRIAAAALDPIEKKPLYHVLPGSSVYSVALAGCNLDCRFCQNAAIALERPPRPPIAEWSPAQLADRWEASGAPALAFTYTEPGVWQDYLIDTARIVRGRGATVVMVTNGFLTAEACDRLADVVDAFNVDLKGTDHFYRELCGACEGPVRDSIRRLAARRHVEVTTMLLEPFHGIEVVDELCDVLVDAAVPVWHISRFYPAGRMLDHPATPERAVFDTVAHLRSRRRRPPFIYAGNTGGPREQRTYCPDCGSLCVDRTGRYGGVQTRLVDGACPACGTTLPGLY